MHVDAYSAEPDRVEAFVRDLESIPAVLDSTAESAWIADALGFVRALRPKRVLLAGLGSSRFAAMLVEDLLRSCGVDVLVQPAGADTGPEPADDLLCVVISASGRTREAVALAERHRGRAPVVAVTRTAGSALAAAADAVAVLPVPAESSGVSCTTFVATFAALLHVATDLCVDMHRSLAPAVPTLRAAAANTRAMLGARDQWLPAAADALDGIEEIAVLAPWSERGAAEQAALHLRECPRRTAYAFETADWLHTGLYTALPGTAVLRIEGSPADAEVEQVLADRGAALVRVPGRDALTRSTAASLLAAELWRRVAAPHRPRPRSV
jgi:fructoselysine-6-P-deglycase FrlB-like protein